MEELSLKEFLNLGKKDLKGKVVVFPTDTIYGIGALIDDYDGIKKIFDLKQRPYNQPLANLCFSIEQVKQYVVKIPNSVKEILAVDWPGALTVIFKKKPELELPFNKETVSFRMPLSIVALKILKNFGPLATTSINIHGTKELNDLASIKEAFGLQIDYIITDKEIFSSVPSTVIDATGEELKVLREGQIKIRA